MNVSSPVPTETEWVVLKFGGTSVSSRDSWDTIAAIVRDQATSSGRALIVCSALAGISNLLEQLAEKAVQGVHELALAEIERRHVDLAEALGVEIDERFTSHFTQLRRLATGIALVEGSTTKLEARMLAFGEILATLLGCDYLKTAGIDVGWLDARECLVANTRQPVDNRHRYLSASCDFQPDDLLNKTLCQRAERCLLTQGFIARDDQGDTVVLGRGGSDTSAAYFAGKLGASRCEIWTDVPGVFTANPKQIPSARLLRRLDYSEAQEVASQGARVLHPRCIEPLRELGIPLHIRCTKRPEVEGTIISKEGSGTRPQVKAISAKSGVTLVSMDTPGMWQQVGFLADVFACFKDNGLSVDLVSTSETNVTVSLDTAANMLDAEQIERLLSDLSHHCKATILSDCAAISLIGRHIRAVLHRLGPTLEVFEAQRIHLLSQAASDLNLTFVVDNSQADRLVRQLHALLFNHTHADRLFGPTWQELSETGSDRAEPAAIQPWWKNKADEIISIARQNSPLFVYDEDSLCSAAEALSSLNNLKRAFYSVKANNNVQVLQVFERTGLGFECVSIHEVEHVLSTFPELDVRRILFTPNFAPRVEFERAFELGVWVTIDNVHPISQWPEVFAGRDILVRIDPGKGRGHHGHVRTAGVESKFGLAVSHLDRFCDLVDRAEARVVGLHAHAGSGIRDADHWRQIALFLADVASRFPSASILDLGGGLGIAERPHKPAVDLAELDTLLGTFREAWPQFELWLEPGRYLVADAGVLVAKVTQVKNKGEIQYVGIETGMNSLIRPALYGAYHEMVNLSQLDQPDTVEVNVVGPVCETGDTLGYCRRMPQPREGDIILIATAGAYGRVMSSSYNRREPAREWFLSR